MSKALLIAFLSHAALWGGSGADLYTTRKAIQAGSVEANPLLGQTLKSQATIILLNNLVIEGSAATLKVPHRKLAAGLLFGAGAFHVGLSFWNLHELKKQKMTK